LRAWCPAATRWHGVGMANEMLSACPQCEAEDLLALRAEEARSEDPVPEPRAEPFFFQSCVVCGWTNVNEQYSRHQHRS
jgi:hypothetical protein